MLEISNYVQRQMFIFVLTKSTYAYVSIGVYSYIHIYIYICVYTYVDACMKVAKPEMVSWTFAFQVHGWEMRAACECHM